MANSYPERPVTLVVNGPPAGGPDTVARIVANVLSKKWSQPVIVENKPGATGMIGAENVVRGDSSGYRLLFTYTALVQAPYVFKKVPYDLNKDFKPVMQVANAPVVLAVRANSPVQNISDYLRLAKSPNKPVTYGSFGIGSSYYIYGEELKKTEGLNLMNVPYKGEALALQDMLGGQIDSTFVSVGTVAPHVRAGTVRALAVVAPDRSTVLTKVPTFKEAGVKGLDTVGWFGVLAPGGTPDRVVQKLATDFKQTMSSPEIVSRLRGLGFEPVTDSDPVKFKAFLDAQAVRWKTLISDAGIPRQ